MFSINNYPAFFTVNNRGRSPEDTQRPNKYFLKMLCGMAISFVLQFSLRNISLYFFVFFLSITFFSFTVMLPPYSV